MANSSRSDGTGYSPTFSSRTSDTSSSQASATPASDTSPDTAVSDVIGGYNPTFSSRTSDTSSSQASDTDSSQTSATPTSGTSPDTAVSDVTGGYSPTFSSRTSDTGSSQVSDAGSSQASATPANDTSITAPDTLKTFLTTLGDLVQTIIKQITKITPESSDTQFQKIQEKVLDTTSETAIKAETALSSFIKVIDSLISLDEDTTEKINSFNETPLPGNKQENSVRIEIKPPNAETPTADASTTAAADYSPIETSSDQSDKEIESISDQTEQTYSSDTNSTTEPGETTLSSADQTLDSQTTPPETNQLPPHSPVATDGPTTPIGDKLHVPKHSPAYTILSSAMDDIKATYPSVPINNTIQAEIAAELMGQSTNPGSQQPPGTIHLTDQQLRVLSEAIAHNINVRRQMAAQQMIADMNVDGFGYNGADFELGSISSDFQQAVLEICDEVIQAGIPYAWGGGSLEGPSQGITGNSYADAMGDYAKIGFDCSGFSRYVFYQATGVEIPRTAAPQCDYSILVDEPMIGDLGFPTNSNPGHVVVYVGNGEIAEAQQSGTNLMYSPASPTYVWKRPPESPNWEY